MVVVPITQQPWNAIEMTIKDPDGHLITLTQSNISKEDFDSLILKKLSVNIGDSFFIVHQDILQCHYLLDILIKLIDTKMSKKLKTVKL